MSAQVRCKPDEVLANVYRIAVVRVEGDEDVAHVVAECPWPNFDLQYAVGLIVVVYQVLCGNDVFRLAKLDTERWKGRITRNAELRIIVIPFSSSGLCDGRQRFAAADPLQGLAAEVKR